MPGAVASDPAFLPNIVPAYAELSSFVHGGPACDLQMKRFGLPEAVHDCRKHAEIAFMMSASMLMFVAMAVSREFAEHAALAGKVKVVLDTFTRIPEARPAERPSTDDASDIFLDGD